MSQLPGPFTGAPLSLGADSQLSLADADAPLPTAGFYTITPTAPRTLTLPSLASQSEGAEFEVKNLAPATAVDVVADGTDQINDAAPAPVAIVPGANLRFRAGRTSWYTLT